MEGVNGRLERRVLSRRCAGLCWRQSRRRRGLLCNNLTCLTQIHTRVFTHAQLSPFCLAAMPIVCNSPHTSRCWAKVAASPRPVAPAGMPASTAATAVATVLVSVAPAATDDQPSPRRDSCGDYQSSSYTRPRPRPCVHNTACVGGRRRRAHAQSFDVACSRAHPATEHTRACLCSALTR
jgi:hypothetical protein